MKNNSLQKQLGLLDVFCLAAGAMISSGLFVLPGIAFEQAGSATVLAYALACIFIIPAMLVQAELATAMPKSGGTYVFIERSLGPLAGTFAGILNWLSIALKSAFALIGLGAIALQFMPEIGESGVKLIAIIGCILFSFLNLVSVKGAGKFQVLLVFILLAVLLMLIGKGVGQVDIANVVSVGDADFHTIIAVSGLVFVSFGGLTKIASVGEEVINPARNLPLGMFLAMAVVSFIYIAIVTVTIGTVEPEQLSGSLVPVGLSARAVLGPIGMILVDVSAALAFITTANAGILSASRTPLAMSRDGLIPEYFSKTHVRYKTPHISLFVTSFSIISVIALLSIEDLVKTASAIMILLFLFLNIAVLTLRFSKIPSYQPPFRSPFFPYLPIASCFLYTFLILEMGLVPLSLTAAFGILSVLWFIYYVKPRLTRESAFVHVVKAVTSKPLQRIDLEDELRQISLERESDEKVAFLKKLEKCPILDIDVEIEASELYRQIASELGEQTGLGADRLFEMFLQRELESSTIVHPGISIPVIVVDEPDVNEVLVVRTSAGAKFSQLHQPVSAMFVFIGSISERNFQLRALMHMAHIVKSPSFFERWSKAREKEQLRDVLLVYGKSK